MISANVDRADGTLWMRQLSAIIGLELRKCLFNRRAILLYFLAASPVALVSLFALLRMTTDTGGNFGRVTVAYAAIYNGLILRTLVFFGCAWVFMNLFRGETIDKSLHYYFLAPVRRELLVAGKYLAGLVSTSVLLGFAAVASMLILFFSVFPSDAAQFFLDGNGFGQAMTYLGVTTLACVGYGAVFLLVGLFFRNPIIPALVLYGWEWLNFLLPPFLKKLSVIHYLHSLVPLPMSEGPFAVLAEPTPAWIAVPGLFLFTAVLLFLSAYQLRRMEIRYAGE